MKYTKFIFTHSWIIGGMERVVAWTWRLCNIDHMKPATKGHWTNLGCWLLNINANIFNSKFPLRVVLCQKTGGLLWLNVIIMYPPVTRGWKNTWTDHSWQEFAKGQGLIGDEQGETCGSDFRTEILSVKARENKFILCRVYGLREGIRCIMGSTISDTTDVSRGW